MRKVRFVNQIAIPSIVLNDAEKSTVLAASESGYRVLSVTNQWLLNDIQNVGEGGLLVGYAHGDYTAADIEECIEATSSIDRGDMEANERANRLVRIVGQFGGAKVAEDDLTLNDGKPITTKLNWFIPIGKTLAVFWYNASGTTFVNGNLNITGTALIRYT